MQPEVYSGVVVHTASFSGGFNDLLNTINGVLWHEYVLFTLLGVGVLFTVWSRFCQWRAVTHGTAVVRGVYDKKSDPGAINHFQALSAALSATVGLGNIGGVAIAIALGGPGAVFWMWVVGFVGMSLKSTEVIQSMLYRNTDDKDDPHGGPMWVASKGLAKIHPSLGAVGFVIGSIFCFTLLISAVTGGNMFQAWNVADLTHEYFGVNKLATGIILAVVVGLVIIGGIKRIGAVAGKLVPLMVLLYVAAAFVVLGMNITEIPGLFVLIIKSAFSPTEAAGAFVGGTAGIAFLWGMKRALFSNEAGQGSAPIAHSAAKTSEPVREGVVAGLEPLIDTIFVCTLTALVILASGAWNRAPEAFYDISPELTQTESGDWTIASTELPKKTVKSSNISGSWKTGDNVFVIAEFPRDNGLDRARLGGAVKQNEDTGDLYVEWNEISATETPNLIRDMFKEEKRVGIHVDYAAATLTAHSFDRVVPGLGAILVTLASWLFAISTMISWSYYGEQGMIFMFGKRSVLPYKLIYCVLVVIATTSLIETTTELDNLTGLGTGVMLFANIPIMLIFGRQAMKAYQAYIKRLKAGEFKPHAGKSMVDLTEGD